MKHVDLAKDARRQSSDALPCDQPTRVLKMTARRCWIFCCVAAVLDAVAVRVRPGPNYASYFTRLSTAPTGHRFPLRDG